MTNCQSAIKLIAGSMLHELEIKRTFGLKEEFER
jgi:hypothetical protein